MRKLKSLRLTYHEGTPGDIGPFLHEVNMHEALEDLHFHINVVSNGDHETHFNRTDVLYTILQYLKPLSFSHSPV